MEAKDKAKELVNRFSRNYPIICKMNSRNMYLSEAKQCALICVDEIIKYIGDEDSIFPSPQHDFWIEVRKEIELL